MNKKILITSALPYANGPLHFGHIAGAYLPADVYARFERLLGNRVLYICGSDEYGVAITLSAESAKRTPKDHVDIFHEINKNLFNSLNISFDHYSRTTWKGHKEPVQQFFLDLLHNGYIEERVTDQLYSEQDGRFLADRYVVGTCPKCGDKNARGDECTHCGTSFEATDLIDPRSKITGAPLIRKATKHWFLLLDKFKDRLLDWLATKEWKPNVVNFIKGYIEDLRPRSITRDSDWGVPVPLEGSEGKVLYVWFDAPIGYISASQEWDSEKWKDFWLDPETKLVNFIGKDNIPFHAAIFPAMVMGQNTPYKLVDELPANEFYKLEGKQFSKSEGWYIDLDKFFTQFTSEQIRYSIAASAPETSDSDFSWKEFQLRVNGDLGGKFGNFVNRVTVFVKTKADGLVPKAGPLDSIDEEFLKESIRLQNEIKEAYASFKVRKASGLVMEFASLGNIYFDAKKPWIDAKDPSKKERLDATLSLCLNHIKKLGLLAAPILPATFNEIEKILNYSIEKEWEQALTIPLPTGHLLGETKVLFRKVEDSEIDTEIKALNQMSEKSKNTDYKPLKTAIDYADFDKLDLRVAEVIAAVVVPKSKKLLKLQVNVGFETRQIVSGIAAYYKPEELIGKKVVIVANLKPATLMGIESQGMILAGSMGDQLFLPEIQALPPGSSVN